MARLYRGETVQGIIILGTVAAIVFTSGCSSKPDMGAIVKRLDAFDERMVLFEEEIKAYDAMAKNRSEQNASAMKTSMETLENQMMVQRQELDQDNLKLAKNLDEVRADVTELVKDVNDRDTRARSVMADATSALREDLAQMMSAANQQQADVQVVLAELTKTTAETVQVAMGVRTAMECLIEAHQCLVAGSSRVAEALRSGVGAESDESQKMYLTLLYAQQKDLARLLEEMRVLSSKEGAKSADGTRGDVTVQ